MVTMQTITPELIGEPRIDTPQEEVITGTNFDYNCIAWSIGNTTDWVWPCTFYNPEDAVDFYDRRGYEMVDSFDKTAEHVALFWNPYSGEVTHAARWLPSVKKWSAKLGAGPLVQADTLSSMAHAQGSIRFYGEPFALFKAPHNPMNNAIKRIADLLNR